MNNIKKIFFTSDTHFYHKNVIEFDKRPFKDMEHMHEVIINNFNSTVPKDGITYFLGDIGFSKTEKLKPIIDQLNGTKILILGNHDKGVNSMYNAGFDAVMYGATMVIANEIVTLSHCPLLGVFREDTSHIKSSNPGENWHGETRSNFRPYTAINFGQFHLHGHVHSPSNGTETILGKQFDVGVNGNNFRPVSISIIESWIAKTKSEMGIK